MDALSNQGGNMALSEKAIGGIFIGGVAAAAIIASAVSGSSGSSNSGPDTGTRDTIKSNCHSAVKGQLRSPATAHFHGESIAKNSDGGWSLLGEVDSENGFGALLTSTFACDTYNDGNVSGTPTLVGN